MYLSRKEIELINTQHNNNVRNIQRLFKGTPRSFYLLTGGSLPGIGLLHQRQLSLFGMICRLPDSNPLFIHASFYFNNSLSYKSWFKQVDELTKLYKLPTCIELLNLKLDKESFKKQVKLRLADHWQRILREEASKLKSLKYFRPQFYSVLFPSNSYISAGNNRYEIAKVNVQMKMLSGRYRTESLSRFWSENKSGVCLLGDPCTNTMDTIPHILVSCPV